MKVTNIKQVIEACPSQWECLLDGVPAYINFRWGFFQLKLNEGKALWNTIVLEEQVGGSYDGFSTTEEMLEWLTDNKIEF